MRRLLGSFVGAVLKKCLDVALEGGLVHDAEVGFGNLRSLLD